MSRIQRSEDKEPHDVSKAGITPFLGLRNVSRRNVLESLLHFAGLSIQLTDIGASIF